MASTVAAPAIPLLLRPVQAGKHFVWPVPGSKSITNRAFILGAMAEGETHLLGALQSDDTRHMRQALVAMGLQIHEGDGAEHLVVQGGLSKLHAPSSALFVGNSGTTVRFMSALAALVPGQTTLYGDEHMAVRPIADLVDGLGQLGVKVECPSGCPPLTVYGGRFTGAHITMWGDKSSQYFTALLLMGGLAGHAFRIEVLGPLVSRPYVEMTIKMVRDFGGAVATDHNAFVVNPVSHYKPIVYAIEPDASAASYPFALAAAGGHEITVNNLGPGSLQGDYRFVHLLERMGAYVDQKANQTTVKGISQLNGIDVDMHHISDTVMTLAAIAPLAQGPTTIRNIANIRIKETDRLLATVTELRRLGQEVSMDDDWMRIDPRPIKPATIECYNDHRIAMSFAVLGSIVEGVTIADPACVAKTYPAFWDHLHLFAQS